jgi:hypothetical protein
MPVRESIPERESIAVERKRVSYSKMAEPAGVAKCCMTETACVNGQLVRPGRFAGRVTEAAFAIWQCAARSNSPADRVCTGGHS